MATNAGIPPHQASHHSSTSSLHISTTTCKSHAPSSYMPSFCESSQAGNSNAHIFSPVTASLFSTLSSDSKGKCIRLDLDEMILQLTAESGSGTDGLNFHHIALSMEKSYHLAMKFKHVDHQWTIQFKCKKMQYENTNAQAIHEHLIANREVDICLKEAKAQAATEALKVKQAEVVLWSIFLLNGLSTFSLVHLILSQGMLSFIYFLMRSTISLMLSQPSFNLHAMHGYIFLLFSFICCLTHHTYLCFHFIHSPGLRVFLMHSVSVNSIQLCTNIMSSV